LVNPITIYQPTQLIVDDVVSANVTECYGNTNASIEVAAYGGTGTVIYSIDGGTTFADNGGLFENLAAGTYEIYISDDHDCIGAYAGNPVIITEPVQVTMTVTVGDVDDCAGNTSGSIDIAAAGGTGVYTYSIDGGANWTSSSSFTALAAGSYVVMAKDNLGCDQPFSGNPVVITEPDAIVYDDVAVVDAGCYGENFGEIVITAHGGTDGLSYSVDGGSSYQSDGVFANLVGGEYNLMIMDGNGCEVAYANNPVMITVTAQIFVPEVVSTDKECDGSLGSIAITANGGVGTLMYSIDDGATYQSSSSFSGLPADTYIVRVKDANGCTQYYAGNPVVVADHSPSDVFINKYPHSGTICVNEIVTLEAYAYGAISYTWEPDGQEESTIEVTSSTPETVVYTVTVINESGCESQESVEVIYDDCIGLAELESETMTINVYPNPNDGEFNLELVGMSQEVQISVIDFAGRLILEEKIFDISADKMEKQFDLSEFERGVYFLRITHGEQVSYKKVVVQ